jgi:hypothetical protein
MRACLAVFVFSTCLGAQASIPRYAGPLDSNEARHINYLHYTPVDIPLLWLSTGDLVISHLEQYSLGDVFGSGCGGSGIYRISGDGGVTTLAGGPGVCGPGSLRFGIGVDPRLRWIVYKDRGGPFIRLDLGTLRADTLSTECRLNIQAPAVSADGRGIAVIGMCHDGDRFGIFILQSDGATFRRVTPRDSRVDYVDPAWSPDGSRIAFSRKWRVGIIDTSGKAMHFIARGGDPVWSPDGQWIAFQGPYQSIHIIHPDGSHERVVFENRERGTYDTGWGFAPEGDVYSSVVWSPDGSALAFSRLYGNGTSIWRLDIATGALRAITAPAK